MNQTDSTSFEANPVTELYEIQAREHGRREFWHMVASICVSCAIASAMLLTLMA